MESTDFPGPNPTPITDVSPSLANQLLGCQLRAGFARDPEYAAWKRPTTHTILGVVAHAVSKAAFKRSNWPEDPAAVQDRLQDLWSAEAHRGMMRLARAWSPARPPPPAEWPGYELTRARTIRRAGRLLATPPNREPKGRAGTGVEVELRDPRSGLVGRADRIERDGRSTRVVDLKTGLHQVEPSEAQRRQLLLYAVLVNRAGGEWPSSIAVEDASGHRYSKQLDAAEAEAALAEVVAAVAAFNAAIGTRMLLAEAAPSPDVCRWCDFRVVCGPFWASLTDAWGLRSVLGDVLKTGDSNGRAYVSVTIQSPKGRVGQHLHVSGLPAGLSPGATRVAVTDWIGTADASDVRARWSTTYRAW